MNRLRLNMAIVVLLTGFVSCFADETPSDNPRIKVHKRFVTLSEIDTGGKVHVKGVPGAIESTSPYTLALSNLATKEKVSLQQNPDGSFEGIIAAGPGDKVRILARNQEKKQSYGTFTVSGGGSTTAPPASSTITAPPHPLIEKIDRKQLIDGLYRFFGTGPTESDIVDPQVSVLKTEKTEGHSRHLLSYQVEKDDLAYAWLLVPDMTPSGGKFPLVLCPHPTTSLGKDVVAGVYDQPAKDDEETQHRAERQYGLDLVRRGFLCFVPDRAGYGQRTLDKNETNCRQLESLYLKTLQQRWPKWSLEGKAVWDLQRAVDFLAKRGDVDPGRIGIIGYSMGAWDAVMLAPFEPRIKAVVLNAGASLDFKREFWQQPDVLLGYLEHPDQQTDRLNVNGYLMAITPRPLLYIHALNDPYEHSQDNLIEGFRIATDYYKKVHGDDPNYKPPLALYMHNDGHSFQTDARELAYTWLDKHLE